MRTEKSKEILEHINGQYILHPWSLQPQAVKTDTVVLLLNRYSGLYKYGERDVLRGVYENVAKGTKDKGGSWVYIEFDEAMGLDAEDVCTFVSYIKQQEVQFEELWDMLSLPKDEFKENMSQLRGKGY